MALRSLKPDGTEGTATLEVTYKNGKEIIKRYGCMVKNDANLEFLIQKHINEKADKTKFKDPKCYAYMYDPDFKEERNEATVRVSCHRFSMPSQPKECTLDSSPHNFVKVQGHIFCPCDSEYFNNSKYFLKEHSKEILVAQDLTQVIFGLMYDKENKFPKFIPLKLDHPLSSNVYSIREEDYEKLEDAGPVLLKNNKTVVGSLKKRGNNEISISIFGNNQEITTASSTDGAPDKRTGQTVATPGDGTGQAAATLGDGTGQAAATLGDGTGQPAATPGDGTGQPAATLGDGTGQPAATPGDGTGQPAATLGDRTGQQTLANLFKRKNSVLDGLCLHLDNEYRVIQNWRDLADLLDAPNDVKDRCECSTNHSPTELLFEVTNVSSTTVTELLIILGEMGRNDVVSKITEKISEAHRNKKVSETLLNDYDLCDEVALLLDKESPLNNNWEKLGKKLKVPKDDLQQIGRGNNPANQLFLHAYSTLEPEKLKGGHFRNLIEEFRRRKDVKDFLDTLGVSLQDDRSIKDVFPPDSDNLRELCNFMNKNAGNTLKDWRHLASAWEIEYNIYNSFDNPEKPKPTKILLEDWLVQANEDFTVQQLCTHLKTMKRIDALEYLESEARS